jgi:TRAP transporter 4TM/12TM fusion protein
VDDKEAYVDEGTGRRTLTGGWRVLFAIGVIGAAGFHLYTGAFGLLASHVQITVHWAFMSFLILLLHHSRAVSRPGYQPWGDVALGIGSVVANSYLILTVDDRVLGIGAPTPTELVLGLIAIIVVLEAARRTTGPVLPITCTVLILYALFGNHLPNLIAHRGFEADGLIAYLYMSPEGIFSLPLAISASYIILFILFGAMLNASGGGRLFTDSAYALAGTRRGGPAKTAVFSSALLGTISGSPVANVVMSGTFTIPLMKSSGVRPAMAGATEAVASTGGSLMPPIMGAAAFIMAEYLNVPYRDVALSAIIPAILYYLTLYWMVDLDAAREGLSGLPRDQLPKFRDVFRSYGHLAVPLAGLIGMLLYGWSPLQSSFYSIVLLVLVTLIRPATRDFARPAALLKALESGITAAMPVAAATAAAGIIVGVLSLTGLGAHFATVMSSIAGDSLAIALVLTMLAAIILGCGMPVSAVYIIMASLTAPSLVRLGIPPLAAHMFIFYFSCIAAITPPVALAAYAGAGIANANPHAVGILAMKLGIVAFVVPYMFAYAPSLLLQGSATEVIIALVPALVGTFLIAVGVQGYSLTRHGAVERLLAFGGGLLLVKPGLWTDVLGLLCLALVMGSALWRRRRARGQTVPNELYKAPVKRTQSA